MKKLFLNMIIIFVVLEQKGLSYKIVDYAI